jgi:hypothetical protein
MRGGLPYVGLLEIFTAVPGLGPLFKVDDAKMNLGWIRIDALVSLNAGAGLDCRK